MTAKTLSHPSTVTSHEIAVWDLPTRLFHWLLVLSIIGLYLSAEVLDLSFSMPLPWGGQWIMGNMDVHMLLGETVLTLVIFRVLWGFIGSGTARFANFIRGPRAVIDYLSALRRGEVPLAVGHNPAGALMIVALLVFLLAQVFTGMFANDDIFSEGPLAKLVSKSTSDALTGVHGLLFNILALLVVFHIAAAVYYRLRGENLIKAMVTGKKSADMLPPEATAPKIVNPLAAIPVLAVAILIVWALVTQI